MDQKQVETKLKLELYRYENIVFGKCKYLIPDLVGTGVLIENSRFQIGSDLEPGIIIANSSEEKTKLNAWGNNENANENAFCHQFEDAELAEEFTINMTRLINRLNGVPNSMQTLVKVLG